MTAPTKKVNQKVTNLTLKRDGNSIEAKWKIPSAMKKESDAHHAEFVVCELDFKVKKGKTSGSVYYGSASHSKGMSYNGFDDVKIRNLGMSTSVEKSYGRSRFHPVQLGRTCESIDASVWGVNSPGEWKSDNTGWWWKRYDGSYPKNSWEYIDKKWYHFNAKGYMQTGSITYDGVSYTLASDGHLTSKGQKGAWEQSGEKWKFKLSNGSYKRNGWLYSGNDWYLFDKDGWMLTGTVKFKGAECKLASDGHFIPPSSQIAGPAVHAEFKFAKPDPPKVSIAYNTANAVATVTVETPEGKDKKERYDTMVKIDMVRATKQQQGESVGPVITWSARSTYMAWTSTTSAKWTKPIDLSQYIDNLQAGEYVTLEAFAYARGIAGDNPSSSKPITASRTVAIPEKATVGAVSVDRKSMGGRIKIEVTPGKLNGNVDTASNLQLERRHGETGSWETVDGATDNGNCKALYDAWGAVWPNGIVKGEKIYYRVKSTRDNLSVYSEEKDAPCLFEALPKETCSATSKLVSLNLGNSGTMITVVMAWKETVQNTGCELSWSEYGNGWNTSDEPNRQLLPDSGQGAVPPDNPTKLSEWKTKTFSISGLTSGKTYYVRVRRYKVYESGNTVYSAYDKSGVATPVKPDSAANDTCSIANVSVNGAVATLTIGINEDNVNTGTELTWADNEQAWLSNEQPDSFNATWPRSAYTENPDWAYKQTIYLRGLEPGKTYYAKARRYLESSSGTTYTEYSKVQAIQIPSGAASHDYDVRCGLVSVEPGADGKSAKAVIGWDGDHTGCEVTWSDDPDAWESSDQPSSFEFDWSDGSSQSQTWSHTSTCYITGLDEGVTYYVRARSYFDGDEKVYSAYTGDMAVTPYSAPESVVLEAPSFIERGKAIECWWEIGSEQPQTEWHIHMEDSPNTSMAEGEGSLCHASIEPERYGSAESVAFFVEAGCGGGLTRSNVVSVGIADKPSCEASCAPVLTAQPASFEVITNDQGARLLSTLYSEGCTMEAPDGDRSQLDGYTVWTQSSTPLWQASRWDATQLYSQLSQESSDAAAAQAAAQDAFDATPEAQALANLQPGDEGYEEAYEAAYATPEGIALQNATAAAESASEALSAHQASDTVYAATVTLPISDLYDGGSYRAEFRTVESVAGLASDTASASFGVEYSHQAPDPSAGIWAVTPDEEIVPGKTYYTQGTEYSYAKTEDAEVQQGKTYYEYDEVNEDYEVVQNPQDEDLEDYYEMTESTVYEPVENPVIADIASYYEYSGVEVIADIDARTATVILAPPLGSVSTDVFDVYRQTPSGYEAIARGVDMGTSIEDQFAPYGRAETAYRVCARTADGDISFSDFGYSMPVHVLRFDWGRESAEFPWNIDIREQMSNNYESRTHADGSVNGYWDRGSELTGSYSTDVVKTKDSQLIRLARRIGEYAGAVWVRDGYGKAMQCNVSLDEVGLSSTNGAAGISFSISAMKTTAQFMPVDKEASNG